MKAKFTLPSDWKIVALRDVARVGNGSTPSRAEPRYWTDGVYPWLPTSKVNDRIITKSEEFVTQAALDECSIRFFPVASILVGMIGQGKTRGMAAYLAIDAAINQNFAAVMPREELDSWYLFFTLDANYERLRNYSHGSNQGALNCGLIESFTIPLPPLPEQRKIAEILRTWDEAVATMEQLIAALQRRKKGLMQRLLTGQVRFPEFGDAPWEEVELGDHLTPVLRAEPVEAGKAYRLIGVRWYLAGAHIHDVVPGDKIVTQALSRIEENDILYNKMWVSKAAFAVAKKEHAGAYGSGEYPQFIAGDGIDVRFIEYAFHDPRFLHDAKALCRGTTGRIRLHPDDFLRLRMRLPSKAEQSKIAEILQIADQEIEAMKQYLDGLRVQKKGLMQRLLTGQVRVQV